MVYLLVAERSCSKTIRLVSESIIKNISNSKLFLICPSRDYDIFLSELHGLSVNIVLEDDISEINLTSISNRMKTFKYRAGWYYQQFLKLSFDLYYKKHFGHLAGYVIWDADTVMLKAPKLKSEDGSYIFIRGRSSLHAPYVKTYESLFNYKSILKYSVISQYMYIDTDILCSFREKISKKNISENWFYIVLDSLSYKDISEFSEYEAYANFVASQGIKYILLKTKWFLLGSDVISPKKITLEKLESVFSGYGHVAFERHRKNSNFFKSLIVKIYAKICLLFKLNP